MFKGSWGREELSHDRTPTGQESLTIPIPGFKTVRQVEENAGTLEAGSLGSEQFAAIDEILKR
jgi:aryl-alcohol dehydrogenase-like predicted oxidoreductase